GVTVLQNAAREPEIVDTAVLLSLLGVHIRGAGTSTIMIEGSGDLHGATYTIIPDRIEARTYLIAVAATHGDVVMLDIISEHMTTLFTKLTEAGGTVNAAPTEYQ